MICENQSALVYLANQACITPHIWLSRQDRLDHPDRIIFGLDASGDQSEPVRDAARLLEDLPKDQGVSVDVMITGSRGLQVTPFDGELTFDAVRRFAEDIAKVLHRTGGVKRDESGTLLRMLRLRFILESDVLERIQRKTHLS